MWLHLTHKDHGLKNLNLYYLKIYSTQVSAFLISFLFLQFFNNSKLSRCMAAFHFYQTQILFTE